jgi:hypothetical protein
MNIKAIIATMLFAPAVASAAVMVTNNEGGGEIVLTGNECIYLGEHFPGLKSAYTWTPKLPKMNGCWGVIDGNVTVIYFDDLKERVYQLNSFRVRE